MYKVEKYLDQCVNSIVNQTYTNLEIILVDDGSPDNCPAMCDEWAHRDSRIRVIHKTNGGLDTARNAGLDVMRGEFVGTVDSDDFIAPNMYERLYTLLIENDADISVCGLVQVDEEGNKLSKQPEPMKDEVLSREDMFNKFLNGTANVNYCYSWNKIYRAKIFREIRFIGGVHEDTATIHRIIGESRKIVVSSEKLHFYRRSKDSITGKMARQKFWCKSYMGHLEAFRDRYTYFMSIGRPDIADISLRHLSGILRYGLSNINYLQYGEGFTCLPDTLRKMLLSRSVGTKLRGVKLALCWLRSIFRPFLDTNPFIEKEKNT